MNFFKNLHYTIDKTTKNEIIYDLSDIQNMLNILHTCYSNKEPCIISDSSLKSINNRPGINIIYKSSKYHLTWNSFFKLNKFFLDKYSLNSTFKVPTHNLYTIFLIQFIDHNASKINSDGKLLVGSENSFFGIYHPYEKTITNCDNVLYFSFRTFMFILYRVHTTPNYIIGKLLPNINIKDNKIIIGNNVYDCPSTINHRIKRIYTIRKTAIRFISSKKQISLNRVSHKYEELIKHNTNRTIYIFELSKPLSYDIIKKLYEYITLTLPCLEDKNIHLTNPPLLMFSQLLNKKYVLVISIEQQFILYIKTILNTIITFLKKIKNTSTLSIYPKTIELNYIDHKIHIISEIYYFLICILLFLPKLYYKLRFSVDDSYIDANYIFSPTELNILYKNKSTSFKNNSSYLKSIFLKTLSIYMNNYYCIIQSDQELDVVPIYDNMSNTTISNLLERSSKAYLSKGFLISYLNTLLRNIDNTFEWPLVCLNIHHVNHISPDMKLIKIHNTSKSHSLPIIINIIHNDETLHISISYKKSHRQIKDIFQKIIQELLK